MFDVHYTLSDQLCCFVDSYCPNKTYTDPNVTVEHYVQWPLADRISENNVWIAGTVARAESCAQGFPYYLVNSFNYTCVENSQLWIQFEHQRVQPKCIGEFILYTCQCDRDGPAMINDKYQ
mgnify:FL=1